MKPALAFLCVTSFLLLANCSQENDNNNALFNRHKWEHGNWRVRGSMVKHMIEDSLLTGLSRKDVLLLLGNEEDTCGTLSYPIDIGLKTGPFGMGGVWLFYLTVQFDSLDRVKSVRYTD